MPWLVCTAGPDKGVQFELRTGKITLGRAPDSEVRLLEAKASRYHCRVSLDGSRLLLEDLNSTNGTKCEGRRLRGQHHFLRLGSRMAIGEDVFEYRRSPDRLILNDVEVQPAVAEEALDSGQSQTHFETAAGDIPPRRRTSWFSFFFRRGKS